MFLTSDAYREADHVLLSQWDWQRITVLLVSHDWDPTRDGAEALAGRRLARALLLAGARVDVLASGSGAEEFRSDRYTVTVVPRQIVPERKLARGLAMIRSTIPELEGPWVPPAVTAGMRIAASYNRDAVIYGRAMPGVSNIAAVQLARMTGLPCVAHFSDPWPVPHVLAGVRKWRAPYKPPLFSLWRRRIIRAAGALTFTNPGQADEVLGADRRRYRDKAFVVTHLGSASRSSDAPPQYDVFHLVHTGNFYPEEHTSAPLLQGLRMFLNRTPAAQTRTRFTQAGWSNGDVAEWTGRCGLGEVVRLAGRLDQRGVDAVNADASLLVAVDYTRPSSRVVLSKLPDYINARRPILAITAPGSSMWRLFHEDGAGLTAHYTSPEQVAERIGLVFDAWRRRRLERWLPKPIAIHAFSAERVLREFAAACLTARAGSAALRASQPQVGGGPGE